MDLNAILNDRAVATADYMGEKLNFRYRPAMVTLETIGLLQSAQDVDELARFFEGAIVSWDLTEQGDDGRKMVPITEATFKRIPGALVRAMAKSIVQDTPKRDEGNESSGS